MYNIETINLHSDSIRMLSNPKQKKLIDDVMKKLFLNNFDLNYQKHKQLIKIQEITLYEKILLVLCCKGID